MTPDFSVLDKLFLRWFPNSDWVFHESGSEPRGTLRVDLELMEWNGSVFDWSVLYVKGLNRSVMTFIPGNCISAISKSRGPELFAAGLGSDYIQHPVSGGPLLIPGTVLAYHPWPSWASKAGDFGWVDVNTKNAMVTVTALEKDGVRREAEGFTDMQQASEMQWSFAQNSKG